MATTANEVLNTEVPEARSQFKRLLATNIDRARAIIADTALPGVDASSETGNDSYERFACVGFSPERELLSATFEQRLPSGFTSDTCGSGSQEYVRFYVDHGSGWVDAGLVARTVYNLADARDCEGESIFPICHSVTLAHDPRNRLCFFPQTFNVRAILSWAVEPPANEPDWVPFWGDIAECDAHVAKATWGPIFEIPQLDPGVLKELFDGDKAGPIVTVPTPQPPPLVDLVKMYANTDVEPTRFAVGQLREVIAAPPTTEYSAKLLAAQWSKAGLDLGDLLQGFEDTTGNINYEELECLGLDDGPGQLTASFRIKRSAGYSGGLCSAGSTEYVAFWVDFDDDCDWNYAGTVEVAAYDLDIPEGGLCYTAALPVDLSSFREECETPVVRRIRAVLSWNTAPSVFDPDAVPTWGNRLDTHVQLRPGIEFDPTLGIPGIALLGGIAVSQIGGAGLTTPDATFAFNGFVADGLGRACPFGGRVVVTGPSLPGYDYRVMVRTGIGPWSPVTSDFRIVDQFGNPPVTVSPGADGWTVYPTFGTNILNTLGWWNTSGDELWDVRLEARQTAFSPVASSATHQVRVDSTPPDAEVSITSGTGDCGKFNVGDTIEGRFTATDDRFGRWSLSVLPGDPPTGAEPVAAIPSATSPATDAVWSLETGMMKPCGYVIRVVAYDLTIMNSVTRGRWTADDVGFCLD